MSGKNGPDSLEDLNIPITPEGLVRASLLVQAKWEFKLYKNIKSELESIENDSGEVVGYRIPSNRFYGEYSLESRMEEVEDGGLVFSLNDRPIRTYSEDTKHNRIEGRERIKSKLIRLAMDNLRYDEDEDSLVSEGYNIYRGNSDKDMLSGISSFPSSAV